MVESVGELTWIEISRSALEANIKQFRRLIDGGVGGGLRAGVGSGMSDGGVGGASSNRPIFCPCVKANAYGHGLVETARVFLESGADWLGVNSVYEASALRAAGIEAPIYILGYVGLDNLEEVVRIRECRIVVYNRETVEKLASVAAECGEVGRVHLKVETGNNRQGVFPEDVVEFAKFVQSFDSLELEGLATHFANIEDTTDHSYAEKQLERFNKAIVLLEDVGIDIPIKHCANSAATLLFPKTHFDMVRAGIATYGMWPSRETYVSYSEEIGNGFELSPAFSWKTKIAQVKEVPANEYIGYGCTYKTTRNTRLAIIPVGYYDGYDRGVSGAHVLIRGQRAPLCGRVCMNIIMVDVSDIPEAELEDVVTLIGTDGDESVSAEQFATWAGTINYEITARVNERIPRIVV